MAANRYRVAEGITGNQENRHLAVMSDPSPQGSAATERFVQQLTAHQSALFAYVRSLVPTAEQASDVLQETNLVLWRRSAEFTDGTSFGAWSRKVAYFQVLAWYRDRKREKLMFDTELLGLLATHNEERMARHDERRQALHQCLGKLPEHSREMIQQRYAPGGSVQAMAEGLGRSVGSVSQSLYRIRQSLVACVRTTLGTEMAEAT